MASIETDRLIRDLSGEAGARRGFGGVESGRFFAVTVALAMAASIGVILLGVGARPHIGLLVRTTPFLFKIACTLSLVVAGIILARRAALPDRRAPTALLLVPSVLLLAVGAVSDTSGLPLTGHSSLSVLHCVTAILLASVPALLLILSVLRTGAPVRPGLTGGIAGLLAGALGASAYTIGCVNDGRTFVALWYSIAILIVTAAGAAIGRRVLAW